MPCFNYFIEMCLLIIQNFIIFMDNKWAFFSIKFNNFSLLWARKSKPRIITSPRQLIFNRTISTGKIKIKEKSKESYYNVIFQTKIKKKDFFYCT